MKTISFLFVILLFAISACSDSSTEVDSRSPRPTAEETQLAPAQTPEPVDTPTPGTAEGADPTPGDSPAGSTGEAQYLNALLDLLDAEYMSYVEKLITHVAGANADPAFLDSEVNREVIRSNVLQLSNRCSQIEELRAPDRYEKLQENMLGSCTNLTFAGTNMMIAFQADSREIMIQRASESLNKGFEQLGTVLELMGD